MADKQEQKEKTRKAIVDALKTGGALDAKTLAERFDVTPMAIRLHLYDLQERGLVDSQDQPRPKGRPAKMWFLTDAADEFFPDGHADLLVDLLDSVAETFGEDAVTKLAFARGDKQLKRYQKEVDPDARLRTRLDRLAKLRTAEGYMAEVERQDDGSYLFIENHCPICAAATKCSGLCASELMVFRKTLGADVTIERVDHILAGARRCAYRVEKTSS